MTGTRMDQLLPGQAFKAGGGYANANYSAEEVALRATDPDIMLFAQARYLANNGDTDAVSAFRWSEALGRERWKPHLGAKPTLVDWGSSGTLKALRFGFGAGLSGALNGALTQEEGIDIWLSNNSYTLLIGFRIPEPNGAEVPGIGSPGGTLVGSRLASSAFRSQITSNQGRIDHRHQAALPGTLTTDFRTGVPHYVMYDFNAGDDDITARVDGAGAGASWTNASMPENLLTGDGLKWMLGGFGSSSVQGALIGEIAFIHLWKGRNLIQDTGEAAALSAANTFADFIMDDY